MAVFNWKGDVPAQFERRRSPALPYSICTLIIRDVGHGVDRPTG